MWSRGGGQVAHLGPVARVGVVTVGGGRAGDVRDGQLRITAGARAPAVHHGVLRRASGQTVRRNDVKPPRVRHPADTRSHAKRNYLSAALRRFRPTMIEVDLAAHKQQRR